jgi:hypothetical protein
MQKVRSNICPLPEYRAMVNANNRAYETHGECAVTRDMRAAVTFLCNFHQMSFHAMAEGDINCGKTDQPYDARFTDKKMKLQIITDKSYMS